MALAAAGPLAFLANELGWLVSEFGRQPWVVYGVFRTSKRDHDRIRSGGHVHRVHAALYRAERGDGVGRAAGIDRHPRVLARPILRMS